MSENQEPPHIEGGSTFKALFTRFKSLSLAEKILNITIPLGTFFIGFFDHFIYDSVKEYWTLVPFWFFVVNCVGLALSFVVAGLVVWELSRLRTDSTEAITRLRTDSIDFRKTIEVDVGRFEHGLRQEIIEYLNWQPELNIEGIDMPEELTEGTNYPEVCLTPRLIPHLFFSEERGGAVAPYDYLECTVQIALSDSGVQAPFSITVSPCSMSLPVRSFASHKFTLTVGALSPRYYGQYDPAQRKKLALSLTLQITEKPPNRALVKAGSEIHRLLRTVHIRLQSVQDLLKDLCLRGYVKRIPPKTDSDPIFTVSPDHPYFAANLHLRCLPEDELRDRLFRLSARRLAQSLGKDWILGAFELEPYKALPQSIDASLNSEEEIITLCEGIRALVPRDESSRQSPHLQKIVVALHETEGAIRYCKNNNTERNMRLFSLIGRDDPQGGYIPTLCLFDLSSARQDDLMFPAYVASFSALAGEPLKLAAQSGSSEPLDAKTTDPASQSLPADRSPILPVSDELVRSPKQLASELSKLAKSLTGTNVDDFIIRHKGCFLNASAELSDTWVSLPKLAQGVFASRGLIDAFLRLVIRAYRVKSCEIFNLCVHDTVLGDKRLASVFQDRGATSPTSDLQMIGLGFDKDYAPEPKHVPQPSPGTDCICIITALDHDLGSYALAFKRVFEAAGNKLDMTAIMIPIISTRSTHVLPFDVGGTRLFAQVVPLFVAHRESLSPSLHAVEYVGSPIQVSLQDAGNLERTA